MSQLAAAGLALGAGVGAGVATAAGVALGDGAGVGSGVAVAACAAATGAALPRLRPTTVGAAALPVLAVEERSAAPQAAKVEI